MEKFTTRIMRMIEWGMSVVKSANSATEDALLSSVRVIEKPPRRALGEKISLATAMLALPAVPAQAEDEDSQDFRVHSEQRLKNGEMFACLPDGEDGDIKTDGCVNILSVKDSTAEPTGLKVTANGRTAYLSIQHSNDGKMPKFDDYATNDIVKTTGCFRSGCIASSLHGYTIVSCGDPVRRSSATESGTACAEMFGTWSQNGSTTSQAGAN